MHSLYKNLFILFILISINICAMQHLKPDEQSSLSNSPDWENPLQDKTEHISDTPQEEVAKNPVVNNIIKTIQLASNDQKNVFRTNHDKLYQFLLNHKIPQQDFEWINDMQWATLLAKVLYDAQAPQ